MKCPVCTKNKAIMDPVLGPTACNVCRIEGIPPLSGPEFTSKQIKEERRQCYGDIIQSHRGDQLSKEYIERYGTRGVKATKEEIKNAKYVWKDTPGWENRGKT